MTTRNEPASARPELPLADVAAPAEPLDLPAAPHGHRSWTADRFARLEQVSSRAQQVHEPEGEQRQRAPLSRRKLALALSVMLAAAVLPFAGVWVYRAWIDSRVRSSKGLVVIDSIPSNARLFLDGIDVGRTPYIALNPGKPGTTVSVRIDYPGAQRWIGSFKGGVATSFTADLQSEEVPAPPGR